MVSTFNCNPKLYSHEKLYIHIYMKKYIQYNNKDERTEFFRKIYLSFYWKGCVWEGVGDSRTKTATYWPPSLWLRQSFFPVFLGCSTGGLGPQRLLIPASSFQLTWTSCRRGNIIIWHQPTSCERHNFALNSTPRQSRSPLISWYLRPDAPVIYTGAFLLLTAWPGRRSICNIQSNNNLLVQPYQTELIAFSDELSFFVRSIPKHNVPVIGRDMNAQIGKKGNHKYSLHNS